MEVIIEDLKYEDIAECYELCKECFNEEYGLEEVQDLYKEISKQSNYRFLVAKVNNKMVGYTSVIMAYNLFDGKRPFMTLWWVCTHPNYRRQGVATKLFNRIEEKYDYIKENPKASFVYDTGYNKLFRVNTNINENDIYLIIITIIVLTNLFIMEI